MAANLHFVDKESGFKKFKEEDGTGKSLMDLYKNEEDVEYVVRLYRQTILHREEYVEYIKQNTRNWDLERIAFMDILIMQMAIAEACIIARR